MREGSDLGGEETCGVDVRPMQRPDTRSVPLRGLLIQTGVDGDAETCGKRCLFLIYAKSSEPSPFTMLLSQFSSHPTLPLVTVTGSQG